MTDATSTALTAADHAFLITLLEQTGREVVMALFDRLDSDEIATKSGAADIVTRADTEAEARISSRIRERWPRALVVGEEDATANPSIVSGLADAEIGFVVDPVDGTWNYAQGLTAFGTILAVVEGGRTTFGAIHDPVTGRTWLVDQGGARLREGAGRARRALAVGHWSQPSEMAGFVPTNLIQPHQRAPVVEALGDFARIATLNCSAHEYRMVAEGRVGFLVAVNLKPWDHLAGARMVEAAGGVARCLSGEVYGPGSGAGPLLVACHAATWSDLRDRLAPLLLD